MASIKTHEQDCIKLIGAPYTEVHLWLDFYASKFPPPLFAGYHRSFRHNSRGLKIISEIFPGRAVTAAKIHLVRDWEMLVLKPSIWDFDLADVEGAYGKALVLGNGFYNQDCPIPPQFIEVEHQVSNMGWSAIMNVYDLQPGQFHDKIIYSVVKKG